MKSSKAEAKLKPTTVRLPEELLKRAKILAVENGTSLQTLIIEALGAHLEGKRLTPRESKK
jgi:predicted DNA binding CopG/RHH family protein